MDGHLGCYLLLDIMNKIPAVTDIQSAESLPLIPLDKNSEVKFLAPDINSMCRTLPGGFL